MIIVGALALCFAGWADAALFWIPPHLGNPDWEIGTIGQTIDALPLGTVGLLLLAIGIRARGGSRTWPRALAILFMLLSLFLAGCVVIFALDLPLILRAANSEGGGGIKRGAAKVLAFGGAYVIAYAAIGWLMWRSTSRREAGEDAAKPAAPEAQAV